MRISTSQIYGRWLAGMAAKKEQVNRLLEQGTSEKRILTPSDDPIASAQVQLLSQRLKSLDSLNSSRDNAETALRSEEGILSNTTNVLLRLKELQQQAGNGALGEGERKALAAEAKTLLNQLQDYANSRDSSGNYIFSGGNIMTAAVSINNAGQYVYNGDSTQKFLPVTGSLTVPVNDTGDNLFMRLRNGNGHFTVNPGTNTGTASATSGSVVNMGAMVPDNYTVSFANNTQGQLVVMVSGATSGNVIPATGLPDDAPLYVEGKSVGFNGIEITLTGAPVPGDTFVVNPSINESIFSTVQRMITNLNRPFTSAADKAIVQTENNQILDQLEAGFVNIVNYQSQLGARVNQLENAAIANKNLEEVCIKARSDLEGIDPVEVATNYQMQLANLQIAMQSFSKIQGLSLLNYL